MLLLQTLNKQMENQKLMDMLAKMSLEELVGAVTDYAEVDKSFAETFTNLVEDKLKHGDEKEARKRVRDSFGQTFSSGRRYGRYDYTDWSDIMEECSGFFEKAEQALALGNLSCAIAYPLQWLRCFSDDFTEDAFSYDEEGTDFSYACERAMDIIEKVITNPLADAGFKKKVSDELSGLAKRAKMFDDYGFANLKAFAKRIQAMTLTDEKALATIEGLIEDHEYNVPLSSLLIQKYNILVSMGKEEEAIAFLEDNVQEGDVCQYLVDVLLGKKDYERTLKVLEEAINVKNVMGDGYYKGYWLRKKIEIYELLKRPDDVATTYRRLFIISRGDFDCYEALKKLIAPSEWKSYLETLMDETPFYSFIFDGKNKKAEILLAEQDYRQLFEYLRTVDDFYKTDLYGLYAHELPMEMQKSLIPYYVEAIRKKAVSAKNRNQYSMIRCHICDLKKLDGSGQTVADFVEELRGQYRRRTAFMSELKKI